MPGTSKGARIRVNTVRMRAPDMRAAFSIAGLICSMNGVMVMITNGTDGTRFTRITATSVRPSPMLYMTVASGMPYVMGGMSTGSKNSNEIVRLNGKLRRASRYAAGTPTRTEMTITVTATRDRKSVVEGKDGHG